MIAYTMFIIQILIVIVAWVLSGALGILLFYLCDMRGKKFNPDYFKGIDDEEKTCIYFSFILGPIFFFFFLVPVILEDLIHRRSEDEIEKEVVRGFSFTCWCYKIANIGLKTKTRED